MIALNSCIQKNDFFSTFDCDDDKIPEFNAGFESILNQAGFGATAIKEDLIIQAQVASSDVSGQFYQELVLQSVHHKDFTAGIRLGIAASNLSAHYPKGSIVQLNCKGLYVSKSYGMVRLGFLNSQFLEPIPLHLADQYIQITCEKQPLQPLGIGPNSFKNNLLNRWVQVSGLEPMGEKDQTFGFTHNKSNKFLYFSLNDTRCNNKSVVRVLTSGFSKYKGQSIPLLNGSISGVLEADSQGFYINPVSQADFELVAPRCENYHLEQTIPLKDILALYKGARVSFGKEVKYSSKVYLIANDEEGNFPERVVVQDEIENPSAGLVILIHEDARPSEWVLGQELYIRFNRLYLDKVNGVFTVGVAKNKLLAPIDEEDVFSFSTFRVNHQSNCR